MSPALLLRSPVTTRSRSCTRFAKFGAALCVAAIVAGCSDDAPLAPQPATLTIVAPLASVSPVSVLAAAEASPAVPVSEWPALPTTIDFGTYEGSGEVVHPDMVHFTKGWNGHAFWTVITPYPKSASQYENPSVFASEDGDRWAMPSGAKNPLATTRRGYLSDPDLLLEPDRNELWLYYREVENRNPGTKKERHVADHLWLTTSANGVAWTSPRRIASDAGRFVVSPSVVRRNDGHWRMYQVDAGRDGCSAKTTHVIQRTSRDGVAWSAAQATNLVQPGYVAWHLDVQYVEERSEYWALVAAYPAELGCTATSLFLATSMNGDSWMTYASPVLAPGDVAQFSAAVYRSTFTFTSADSLTLWYSGARVATAGTPKRAPVFAWSAAVSHTTAESVLARVRNQPRSALEGSPQGSLQGSLLVTAVGGAGVGMRGSIAGSTIRRAVLMPSTRMP